MQPLIVSAAAFGASSSGHGTTWSKLTGAASFILRSRSPESSRPSRGSLLFILETNGILIGHDTSYAEELAHFEYPYVRVSLKGATEQEFATLTGAKPEGFELQIEALERLHRAGVDAQPAVMASFSTPETLSGLRRRLGRISAGFEHFESEELVLYGDVEERLRKAGLAYRLAYRPESIPPEQV